jgi:hypothetical protein
LVTQEEEVFNLRTLRDPRETKKIPAVTCRDLLFL